MRSMWFGALVALLAFAGAATAGAPVGSWVLISTWTVGPGVDAQEIPVGAGRGQFDRLYLAVANNPLNVLDIRVTYANGNTEDIPVRTVISKGGSSKVLELKGTDRRINVVKVTYEKFTTSTPAGVSLYGSQP